MVICVSYTFFLREGDMAKGLLLLHWLSAVFVCITAMAVQADKYRSYEEVNSALAQLEASRPDTAKLVDLGKSVEGRLVRAIKISDAPVSEDNSEPDILIVGGQHARERISIEVALRIAEHLVHNYGNSSIKPLVDTRETWIIPLLNPDGYEYSWATDRDWRKNRSENIDLRNMKHFGVDLNRNFEYEWSGLGSSTYPGDIDYRGLRPFSEPENVVIKNLIEAHETGGNVLGGAPHFTRLLSYHSYSQLILYPWSYTDDEAPDKALLRSIAENMRVL